MHVSLCTGAVLLFVWLKEAELRRAAALAVACFRFLVGLAGAEAGSTGISSFEREAREGGEAPSAASLSTTWFQCAAAVPAFEWPLVHFRLMVNVARSSAYIFLRLLMRGMLTLAFDLPRIMLTA